MIWGGPEEISEMNLFFPGNPFRIKIFSSARPLKIYFFLGKASQNLFFPRQGLSKFIFSSARPLKIYFFPKQGLQKKFFFPGEVSSKIFLSRMKRAAILLSWVKPPC